MPDAREPESRNRRGGLGKAIRIVFRSLGTLIAAIAIYLLSFGPALWMVRHGVLDEQVVRPLYAPLSRLAPEVPGLERALRIYLRMWAPDLG